MTNPAKRNLFIILLLGFSSGLPLALTSSTLQAWFTVNGASLVTIGMLGLIGQPYIYKFLWSPLLDRYHLPVLGRRRGWLLLTQLGLLIAIIAMAFAHPKTSPYLLSFLALMVAFLSATQDMAIDAYRTEILPEQHTGLGAALYTWGFRISMMVSGGLALIFADYIGWKVTYFFLGLLMLVGITTTLLSAEPLSDQKKELQPQTLRAAILEPMQEFFARKAAVGILLFIVLYKLGDAMSVSLATPFLIRDLGFSLTTVGIVNKGIGLVATMAGILVGGAIMTRISLYRALFLFGLLQTAAIFTLMQLALLGKNYHFLVFAISADNFCNAMGTVACVAFLTSLCDHRYTATQFALFSALAAVGRVFVAPVAGVMLEHMSWATFFGWAIVACLPGLLLLRWLRGHVNHFANNLQSATA